MHAHWSFYLMLLLFIRLQNACTLIILPHVAFVHKVTQGMHFGYLRHMLLLFIRLQVQCVQAVNFTSDVLFLFIWSLHIVVWWMCHFVFKNLCDTNSDSISVTTLMMKWHNSWIADYYDSKNLTFLACFTCWLFYFLRIYGVAIRKMHCNCWNLYQKWCSQFSDKVTGNAVFNTRGPQYCNG